MFSKWVGLGIFFIHASIDNHTGILNSHWLQIVGGAGDFLYTKACPFLLAMAF